MYREEANTRVSAWFSSSARVFDPLNTQIVVLSELGEGREKPAAEKRKIGCNEKGDSRERKEWIRGKEQKTTTGLTSTNRTSAESSDK